MTDPLAEEACCGWQPIETAPNHECEIIAWDGFSVFHAYWYGQHRFGETVETHSGRPHISHWMLVPEPPAPIADTRPISDATKRMERTLGAPFVMSDMSTTTAHPMGLNTTGEAI